MRLLQLYPLIGQKLQTITPAVYLLVSAAATLTFWGITCGIMFDNPVEAFLNKILSDAKTLEEAKQLIESGFEYVCDMEDCKLFRKRK